ncbi:hypothetical protein Sru01_14280 [Sphaerisporangium rufum]|uniref:Metalloprotease n=1 Tax=Sphaerisporangium rufum TaxID=1381558 RepID=A0A919QYH8_9ACTN|nr:neutral zinc metallopeptidase [Sphaerisporangium rufum]GII76446.1 hypothetical protein Sru01_14280 [Sphaerisporangium rufum]
MSALKPSLAASAVLLASTFLAAAPAAPPARAAAAHPIRNAAALTGNALYGTGRLPRLACPERPVREGSAASARQYVLPLFDCLGTSWAAALKKARLPFSAPRLQFISRPQRVCGEKWPKNAQGLYCPSYRKIVILLDKHITREAADLFLMDVIAHEYGHHVQNLAGIERAFNRLRYRNKSELYEQYRRLELQAECFAGAFMGSIWNSLDRTSDDWRYLLDATRESGDENSKVRDHGKGRNIATWLDRGFRAAAPDACNTWSAGASRVATAPA